MIRKIFWLTICFLNLFELVLIFLKVKNDTIMPWIVIFIPLIISTCLMFLFFILSILRMSRGDEDE